MEWKGFTMLEFVNDKFNAHQTPYGQALKQEHQIVSQIPLGCCHWQAAFGVLLQRYWGAYNHNSLLLFSACRIDPNVVSLECACGGCCCCVGLREDGGLLKNRKKGYKKVEYVLWTISCMFCVCLRLLLK